MAPVMPRGSSDLRGEQLAALEKIEAHLVSQADVADPFIRQVYDLRLLQTRAAIAWIKTLP